MQPRARLSTSKLWTPYYHWPFASKNYIVLSLWPSSVMLDHANVDFVADQFLKFQPYDVSDFKKRNPPCSIPDSEFGIKLNLLEAAQ